MCRVRHKPICGTDEKTLKEARSTLGPFPASASLAFVDGDIGDPKTAAKIVDTAVSRYSRVDVLVNNAGIFIAKPFTEYTTEDFDVLVSTTLAGFDFSLAIVLLRRHSAIETMHIFPQICLLRSCGSGL
jgi:NAD(P)-dependent dehydrogenase (short-subunit alcohol dehydrogenase family)